MDMQQPLSSICLGCCLCVVLFLPCFTLYSYPHVCTELSLMVFKSDNFMEFESYGDLSNLCHSNWIKLLGHRGFRGIIWIWLLWMWIHRWTDKCFVVISYKICMSNIWIYRNSAMWTVMSDFWRIISPLSAWVPAASVVNTQSQHMFWWWWRHWIRHLSV